MPNAVADHVQARGTIRAMDAETDHILKNSFEGIVAQSELRGFKTTMDYVGYPAVENHSQAVIKVVKAASMVLLPKNINSNGQPMTGSEDFSYMVNACRQRMGRCSFLAAATRTKVSKTICMQTPIIWMMSVYWLAPRFSSI